MLKNSSKIGIIQGDGENTRHQNQFSVFRCKFVFLNDLKMKLCVIF
jgi:hypothetical protein